MRYFAGPDGKKTVETFVEEKEAGEESSFGGDFFKNRMEEMKAGSADEDEKREGKKEGKKTETTSSEDEQEGEFTTFQLEALEAHNLCRWSRRCLEAVCLKHTSQIVAICVD